MCQCLSGTQKFAKHSTQIGSLVRHITDRIDPAVSTCFLEFGAGRAELSYYLHKARHDTKDAFIFIDRKAVRNKVPTLNIYTSMMNFQFDGPIRHSLQNGTVERLTIDIKDLDLHHVPSFRNSSHCVCYSKHLCGAATDLTFSCLLNALKKTYPF